MRSASTRCDVILEAEVVRHRAGVVADSTGAPSQPAAPRSAVVRPIRSSTCNRPACSAAANSACGSGSPVAARARSSASYPTTSGWAASATVPMGW